EWHRVDAEPLEIATKREGWPQGKETAARIHLRTRIDERSAAKSRGIQGMRLDQLDAFVAGRERRRQGEHGGERQRGSHRGHERHTTHARMLHGKMQKCPASCAVPTRPTSRPPSAALAMRASTGRSIPPAPTGPMPWPWPRACSAPAPPEQAKPS